MALEILTGFVRCLFYLRYCTSDDLINALKSAVVMGDNNGLDYILETYPKKDTERLIKKYSEEFLINSYYNSHFAMVEQLIKVGAKLKGEYISHIKHLPRIEIAQKHLNNIKNYIDQKTSITLSQVVLAHYSSALIIKNNKACIDFEEVLLSITYTNDKKYIPYFNNFYSELYNHNHPIIQSIILFFGVFNHQKPSIKILAPVILDDTEGAFYSSEGKLIYSPFHSFSLLEKAYFIHEASHYLDNKISQNGGRPFAKNNNTQLEAFDIAATKTLHSIGKTMKLNFDELPDGYNYHTAVYDLLLNSSIALFFFNSLLKEDTSLEIKNIIFNNVDRQFDIEDSLIIKYGKEEAIHITVNNIVKDLNFTSDYVIVLERIGEYVSRPNPQAYSKELLVRLPEFIIRGMDQDALSHFSPLEHYWLEHVSPVIQQYSDKYKIKECNKIDNSFRLESIQPSLTLIGNLEETDL